MNKKGFFSLISPWDLFGFAAQNLPQIIVKFCGRQASGK